MVYPMKAAQLRPFTALDITSAHLERESDADAVCMV